MSYFNSIVQKTTSDPNNTSTANLAGGATFTGATTPTLGLGAVGLQVSLNTDQNCLVYVDQSPDGIHWDLYDPLPFYVGKPFGWTWQAILPYYRVRVINQSASVTTYFRLESTLIPVSVAVPRSLSAKGNLKVGVYEIEGGFGTSALVTPQEALKMVESVQLIGAVFDSTVVDPNIWTTTPVSGGSANVVNSDLTLATNTNANAGETLQSIRFGRYVPDHTNYFYATAVFPPVSTISPGTCQRRLGAFLSTDGFYFELDSYTSMHGAHPQVNALSIGYRKASVDTLVANGSFNGDYGLTYVLDNAVHIFEIFWTTKATYFFIDNVLLHTVFGQTTSLVGVYHLPIRAEIANAGGNNANNTLVLRGLSINRLGQLVNDTIVNHIAGVATTVLKYGAGRLHRIVNNRGTVATGSVTVYDNTAGSGTVLAVIDTSQSGANPGTLEYQVNFYTGLTIVTVGGNTDLTVVYE